MRILSCSGGGIRGLASAIWLREIERRVGAPLREHFQLIAGTSTGALLACGVAAGLPAERFVRFYLEQGPQIFPRGARWLWGRLQRSLRSGLSAPLYDLWPLALAAQGVFGTAALGSLARTMVASYEATAPGLQVWKSWRAPDGSIPIWEACTASAAAPAYFPAHIRGRQAWIDGGVGANDPTVCAIVEALRLGAELDEITVVSLAVSAAQQPFMSTQEWGPAEWAVRLHSVVLGAQAELVEYQARHLLADGRYIRLATNELAPVALDDASPQSLAALVRDAETYLRSSEGVARLEEIEALLLDPREAA